MEPTAREADADLITVMWAWADGLVTDDEARGAVILHRQARLKLAGASLTPTPHRSPVVGLERGAVGVSAPDTRRACWSCRYGAPGMCFKVNEPWVHVWQERNINDDGIPFKKARNCPGYEDKP